MRLKSEHVSMNDAIELGSLEIRKLFKDLNPTALDKKVNVDYLEKELGLKRFFPQTVINSYKVCDEKYYNNLISILINFSQEFFENLLKHV
jgi:hypothetical protein